MAALALVALLGLAEAVHSGRTAAVDAQVRTVLHAAASPGWTALFRVVTQLGAPAVQIVGTPLIALIFWKAGWRHRAVLYVVAMAGAGVLLWVLKMTFQRARPEEAYFAYPLPHSYSFPSGHALLSLCFFGVLAAFLAEHQPSRLRQALIWLVSVVLILLIGISRIYFSVHYFTDVVAGFLAATIWSTAVAVAYHRISHRW